MSISKKARCLVAVSAVAIIAPLALASGASADGNGTFAIEAASGNRDSTGKAEFNARAGVEVTRTNPEDNGSSAKEELALVNVSPNFYTRKSGGSGSGVPKIVIPRFSLPSDGATAKDWVLKIDRTMAPFDSLPSGEVVTPTGMPGWATMTSTDTEIIITNNQDFAKIGGGNPTRDFDQLEFEYVIPHYSTAQTSASLITLNGGQTVDANGEAQVRVSLNDENVKTWGRWSANIDLQPFMDRLNASEGTLAVTDWGAANGFTVTRSGSNYVLNYVGNDYSKLIKGSAAAAAARSYEDVVSGDSIVDTRVVKFTKTKDKEPEVKENIFLSADGRTEIEILPESTAWNIQFRINKAPALNESWSVDLSSAVTNNSLTNANRVFFNFKNKILSYDGSRTWAWNYNELFSITS